MDPAHRLVEDHFAGRASAAADRRMWRHLPGCDACRGRYRALSLLESLEPDAGARARDRLARAVFAPRPRPRAIYAAALAAAAALVLLVALPREQFKARGGAPADTAARPSLSIVRLRPDGAAERVGTVIHAGDSLAFSYLNPPEIAASHLMIFAVDQTGHVYWFWPAWTSAAGDPAAISVAASAAPVELAEAVRHPVPPGELVVHALFARRPYHVREIEAAVAAHALGTLDGTLVRQTLQVMP
jgi:hypothetical protein